MRLLIVIFAFLANIFQLVVANDVVKCCERNFEVKDSKCARKTTQRHDIFVKFYLSEHRGECIDTSGEDFFVFKADNGTFTPTREVQANFNKCCPLGYNYNITTRSCTKVNVEKMNFFSGNFIRIGLNQCKIAVDHIYKTFNAFENDLLQQQSDLYCKDQTVDGEYVIRRCQQELQLCKTKKCFKKCCPEGQSFVGGATCQDSFVHGINIKDQYFSEYIENIEDDYEVIYGTKCPRISLITSNNFQYKITKNGSFRYFYNFTKEFVEQDVFNFESYCIEHVQKGDLTGYFMFDCYTVHVEEKFTYTLASKILSCIFLLLTVIIYVYLGDTRKIFGKILISYCIAVFSLMIALTVAHMNLEQSLTECKIRGYFITWLTLSTFTWLNIMSMNIWWTFSTPQGTIGNSQQKRDIKKFIKYSCYGWGLPLLIVLIIFIMEYSKCLPEPIHPYIGIFYCMFEKRNYSPFIFYLLPQLIFQFTNMIIFIKTTIYCIQVKNEINKLNEVHKSNENRKFAATKEKLALIIKLATVMGVIYIFEVATGFFNDIQKYGSVAEILEIILYYILSSQGIFIFIIFVCKKKTFEKLRKKLNSSRRKTSQSMSFSQSTSIQPLNRRQLTKTSLDEI